MNSVDVADALLLLLLLLLLVVVVDKELVLVLVDKDVDVEGIVVNNCEVEVEFVASEVLVGIVVAVVVVGATAVVDELLV